MGDAADWVPMRWPEEWTDPALLSLLKGTPINCLVIDAGAAAGALKGVVERGRREGIEFPTVSLVERSKVTQTTASPVIAVTGNVWPSIKLSQGTNRDRVEAGPTGVPWVDSNGWVARLAQTLNPGKSVWIVAEPPDKITLTAESYMLAASDAAAHGGRWLVSLGSGLAGDLATRKPAAWAAWKKIIGALAFFEQHREWLAYRTPGVLGVLSDFAGPNEFLSTEVLNLISRRHLPCRILVKAHSSGTAFTGLKAILYPDQDAPSPELRKTLAAFTENGGAVISQAPSASLAPASPEIPNSHPRFRVYATGKGRIAVAREEIADPYVVAADTHTLLGRSNDVLRVWNGGPTNSNYTASADSSRALVQLVSYIQRPVTHISLGARGSWRTARLRTLEGRSPQPLQISAESNGVELHLPPVSVYSAVELEK